MAWYALYKWYRPWSKKGYPNMVYWYKEYVLKTPEQREYEQQKRKKEAKESLYGLMKMTNMLSERIDTPYTNMLKCQISNTIGQLASFINE